MLFACRQAQDKASDYAAQAQVKAQELVRDVSPPDTKLLHVEFVNPNASPFHDELSSSILTVHPYYSFGVVVWCFECLLIQASIIHVALVAAGLSCSTCHRCVFYSGLA